ncbi:MAG TPA: valine--tRNA ligase [Candidatus Fimiplasma intestinipullorum]|uniref:Valine--tRNA ligase n=1 Tax=Candidatus Fimiplasma intestinipullorum TaxID=2840825 RepID=A0A9D1KZI4_9FIRM|nr:valine--tRNA ligase [Candidatus Fimiplasma intestinipullorum]
MKKELAPKYNHQEVEKGKYQNWLDHHYFEAGDTSKKPYAIVIPPPNVTGKLHLGHAWDTTLQDMIIRYKRMKGFDALWLPGMDHAAIATEVKVVEKLKKQGINKRDLGREGFLEKAWEWKEEYAKNIRDQWSKLGLSLDYSRERFTLDEGLNKAVTRVFVDYYRQGLIYRGERIINWDPVSQTALSNEEVIYQDDPGAFYHLKYYLEDHSRYLEVATTRPETLFGDTAVAVNPKDERYKDLVGQYVILPIVNKRIPIIADMHADPEFGTGVVKITPAHDPNDFEVGNRHHLERVVVMNPDATMNENAGKYCGMSREACREALVKDLEEADLLIEIEPMVHSVGHSERTHAVVEPYLSKQWFVRMDKLAKQVLEQQADADKKIHFYPARFEKTLNQWMENCFDWCISRQLWWGHRIPAWYRGEEIYVGESAPEGEGWVQDEDVLDTWFSSALWPFSTLGWPEKTEDLQRYYPTNVLVTAYDIIFFWVARMAFQGLELTGQRPFKDCLIHGLIRDEQGRKMSKSLGNGVDPMEVIDTYGADALRYFLTTNSAPGQDLRYIPEKVEASWNFINKIWNASRFVLMNIEEEMAYPKKVETHQLADRWILHRLNQVIAHVDEYMDKYEFVIVGTELYRFIWDDFCSWYIELAKVALNGEDAKAKEETRATLVYVLNAIVKMLHPFMPFVTEEIYQAIPHLEESICITTWPEIQPDFEAPEVEKQAADLIEIIKGIREIRVNYNIKNAKEIHYHIRETADSQLSSYADQLAPYISRLGHAQCLGFSSEGLEGEVTTRTIRGGNVLEVSLEGLVDFQAERAKQEKEKDRLEKEIQRCEKMLANPNFVAKAPAAKIAQEKEKLANYRKQYESVLAGLAALSK